MHSHSRELKRNHNSKSKQQFISMTTNLNPTKLGEMCKSNSVPSNYVSSPAVSRGRGCSTRHRPEAEPPTWRPKFLGKKKTQKLGKKSPTQTLTPKIHQILSIGKLDLRVLKLKKKKLTPEVPVFGRTLDVVRGFNDRNVHILITEQSIRINKNLT